MARIFWDAYGMVELQRGNPAFQSYSQRYAPLTSRLHLMEVYYVVLRSSGEEAAKSAFAAVRPHAAEATDEAIQEAMAFRLRLRRQRKRLSYADAVGYTMARHAGVAYLTGDPDLRGLPNVEFVR